MHHVGRLLAAGSVWKFHSPAAAPTKKDPSGGATFSNPGGHQCGIHAAAALAMMMYTFSPPCLGGRDGAGGPATSPTSLSLPTTPSSPSSFSLSLPTTGITLALVVLFAASSSNTTRLEPKLLRFALPNMVEELIRRGLLASGHVDPAPVSCHSSSLYCQMKPSPHPSQGPARGLVHDPSSIIWRPGIPTSSSFPRKT